MEQISGDLALHCANGKEEMKIELYSAARKQLWISLKS